MTRRVAPGCAPPPAPRAAGRTLSPEDVRRHIAGVSEHGRAATAICRRMVVGRRTLLRDDLSDEAREEGSEAWREYVTALWEELRAAYGHYWFLKRGGSDDAADSTWSLAMPGIDLRTELRIEEFFDQWPQRLEPPERVTAAEGALLVKWGWAPHPRLGAPQWYELREKVNAYQPF